VPVFDGRLTDKFEEQDEKTCEEVGVTIKEKSQEKEAYRKNRMQFYTLPCLFHGNDFRMSQRTTYRGYGDRSKRC